MSGSVNFDGNNVQLDWATEETQREILRELSITNAKSNSKSSASNRAKNAANRKATNNLNDLGDDADYAGKKLVRLAQKAGSAAKDHIDDIYMTAKASSSLNSSFFKLIGKAGPLGTVLGMGITMVEKFANAQIDAIQSGFEFSNQLISTRSSLADIGLNFADFTNIIATNGLAIRSLGDTGTQAASNFADLVKSARDSSKSMGYFGMSSLEIAGELADTVDSLRKSGLSGNILRTESAKSFNVLNREVMGYAKLTGKSRRDILRNQSMVTDDSAFLSTMSTLGKSAEANSIGMTAALTSMFGDSGGTTLISLVKNLIESKTTGINVMTNEQTATLQSTPALAKVMYAYANKFIASANSQDTGKLVTRDFVKQVGNVLTTNEGKIRKDFYLYNKAGNGNFAEYNKSLLDAVIYGRNSVKEINKTGNTLFDKGISDTTAALVGTTNAILALKEQIAAATLSMLGFDPTAKNMSAVDFAKLGDNISQFGKDNKGVIGDKIQFMLTKLLNGKLDGTDILVGLGVAAMFAPTGLIAVSMATGMGKLIIGLGKKFGIPLIKGAAAAAGAGIGALRAGAAAGIGAGEVAAAGEVAIGAGEVAAAGIGAGEVALAAGEVAGAGIALGTGIGEVALVAAAAASLTALLLHGDSDVSQQGIDRLTGTLRRTAYNNAFELSKNGKTAAAAKEMKNFADNYPDSVRPEELTEKYWTNRNDQRIQNINRNRNIPNISEKWFNNPGGLVDIKHSSYGIGNQDGSLSRRSVTNAIPNADAINKALQEANRLNRKILEAVENQ